MLFGGPSAIIFVHSLLVPAHSSLPAIATAALLLVPLPRVHASPPRAPPASPSFSPYSITLRLCVLRRCDALPLTSSLLLPPRAATVAPAACPPWPSLSVPRSSAPRSKSPAGAHICLDLSQWPRADSVFRYSDLQPVGMGAFGLVWCVAFSICPD